MLEQKKLKLLEDLNSSENRNKTLCPNSLPINDPNQILSHFSEILQEYNILKTGNDNWNSCLKTDQICLDFNNNETEEIKKQCFKYQDANNNICHDNDSEKFETSTTNVVKENCSCICDGRCHNYYREINGRYVCCCTEESVNTNKQTETFNCDSCTKPARPIENVVVDISTSIRKTFDTLYLSRKRNSSESENISCVKKKIHSVRKCGNWCEETASEEPDFNDVIKNYAKDHSDRSNVGKSLKKDSCIKKKTLKKIEEEPVIEQKKKLEGKKDRNENCSSECNSTSRLEHHPMLITKDQGLMEVHITCLQLSKTAVRLLLQASDASFFVSWDVRGQNTAFTPALNYPKLNFDSSTIFIITELFNFLDYIFDEYITFQVHILYPDEATHTIAQTKLCVKEVLDYPQNKMQYISTVTSTIPCSLGTNFGQLSLWVRLGCDLEKIKDFKAQRGIVSEDIYQEPVMKRVKKDLKDESDNFYRTELPNEIIKRKKQKAKDNLREDHEEDRGEDQERFMNGLEEIVYENKEKSIKENSSFLEVLKDMDIDSEKETDQKYAGESLLELSNRNSKIIGSKSTSEITENEASEENNNFSLALLKNLKLKTDNSNMTKESSAQIETEDIVEFNRMLSNSFIENQPDSDSTLHEIHEVFADENWDKYREKALNVPDNISEKADDEEFIEDGSYSLSEQEKSLELITIEINTIVLFQGSFVFQDPDIKQLYVEYSFLGYAGENMESKSVLVPEPPNLEMIYNFKREFLVDAEKHPQQRQFLHQMLNDAITPTIKFYVVSEPLEDEQDKECKEVGFAQLNLKDYVSGTYPKNMSLTILNTDYKKSLGILRVTVDGIDVMKNCF